ncbi:MULTISPECIES: DUF2156 domain-containing protein [Bacillus]|uniref:DUF2156 domain-containing protein n=1 Tax=Bacillus TaxID=1386 RepID=UPI000303F2D5|nr:MULTISPECIES: phosphatidylglycerol lysyltransferase domain-containing protein [Bacillus]
MLAFKSISLQDKSVLDNYFKKTKNYLSDYCIVDVFIWSEQCNTEYCIKEDFLFVKMNSILDQTPVYMLPIGSGDLSRSISYIQRDALERGIFLIFTSISYEQKKWLETHFPNQFIIEELRDLSDYIYRSQDLISLKGNKYHSKKNQINRFMKMYQNRWKYESVSAFNMEEIIAFHEKWCLENASNNHPIFYSENKAVTFALENMKELDIIGGALRLDESIIAFTLGARTSKNMIVIQVEKADSNIRGAYQMINQQFAIANCQDVMWINREEDLGIDGLRKAKNSYHPAFLGTKYRATLKNGDE